MAVANQFTKDLFAIWHGDNMEVMKELKDESTGISVYSPPFPELYAYSNDPRDMSNCTTYEEGLHQFDFVINQIYRLTKPGRVSCVHCMDLKKGQRYQRDFPGDIISLHEKAGFHFYGRVTIWKDAWDVARRTRMRSLMHKTLVEDSSKCRPCGADYILFFIKGGENQEPIEHPYGLKEYAGATPIPGWLVKEYSNFKGDQKKNRLSHWIWRQYASPVWMDIRPGRLLKFDDAKETEEENHVCPLQLDVIERCLILWSNPSDILFTPFMGIGSEVCGALMNGRKGMGVELKETYYNQAKANILEVYNNSGETSQQDLLAKIKPNDIVQ